MFCFVHCDILKLLRKLGLSQTCCNTESLWFHSTVRDLPARAENDATSFPTVSNNLNVNVPSFSLLTQPTPLGYLRTYKLRHIEKVTPYPENWYFNLPQSALAWARKLIFDNWKWKVSGPGIEPQKRWNTWNARNAWNIWNARNKWNSRPDRLAENFFSKTVIQGQNAAINLIITIFILSHRYVIQEWYKWNKKAGTAGQLTAKRSSEDRRSAKPWNAITYLFAGITHFAAQCLTFFSKIVGQRAKNAVTPIKMVSCVSHMPFGTVGTDGGDWHSLVSRIKF